MAWRGQSLRLRFHCREPASWVRIRKPPRWSAERGPGRPGTGWSRVAGATERKSAPVGAPSTPHRGDGIAAVATAAGAKAPWARRRTRKRRHMRRDGQTRAQQRAAGTNNTALFDIVNMTTANGSLRAPRCRTRRARPSRVPGERSETRDLGATRRTAAAAMLRCASRRAGSRVSCRSRIGARCTRPGHEIDARPRHSRDSPRPAAHPASTRSSGVRVLAPVMRAAYAAASAYRPAACRLRK